MFMKLLAGAFDLALVGVSKSDVLAAQTWRNPKFRNEFSLTVLALLVTTVAAAGVAVDVGGVLHARVEAEDAFGIIEQSIFIVIVFGLVYGNIVYHLCRLGNVWRLRKQAEASIAADESLFDLAAPPSLTVLVPSYKEEEKVVFQTLLSAALQRYSSKRVVLLIDDSPTPKTVADQRGLNAMRNLPGRLTALLAPARVRFATEAEAFDHRVRDGSVCAQEEVRRLADLCLEAADVYDRIAAQQTLTDHFDTFFAENILNLPARDERARAERLKHMAENGDADLHSVVLGREYRRLAAIFSATFHSFERKQYANLSHAANKAMNLNSYIGLMGKAWVKRERLDGGKDLVAATHRTPDLVVPDSDFLITLDADSLLLPDYALKLVSTARQPDFTDVAILQTPYSAYPSAATPIERIAGATTDIMHLMHQGFTAFGATYWVGANALIRRRALDDIVAVEEEDGKKVAKYIQDRTVIEDTESTVDLLSNGWRLFNYPDQLAYSATPPDYGSLLVQRRRWANGGLIILPKLLRLTARNILKPREYLRAFVQIHYLISLALSSFGVLLLILFPFEDSMLSYWLPLTAAPYFLLYGRDLKRLGYKWIDLPRVYALNLLLIPINLGGVTKSIHQILTGEKTPFARTPKVASRTVAPPMYILVSLAIALYCLSGGVFDSFAERWAHATFALINVVFFSYGLVRYIGIREGTEDLLTWHLPISLPIPSTRRLPRLARASSSDSTGNSKKRPKKQGIGMLRAAVISLVLIMSFFAAPSAASGKTLEPVVAFRFDDIQHWRLSEVQRAVIGVFAENEVLVTLSVIGGFIGEDTKLIETILSRSKASSSPSIN